MKLLVLMLAGTATSMVEGLARCDSSANERKQITKSAMEKLGGTGDFDVIEVRKRRHQKELQSGPELGPSPDGPKQRASGPQPFVSKSVGRTPGCEVTIRENIRAW